MPKTKKRGVTSSDVARLAGVSPASVTRVFNPNWEMKIRPDIQERVMAAANQLNYTPNAFARMLAGNRTDLVAIVLGPATGPYYSQILLRFVYAMQQCGKQVLPFTLASDMSYRKLFERIKPFRVDAIILTSAASGAAFEPNETDTPVILLEQVINGLPVHSVCSDTFSGGKMVADMLVENGHKRIALISGNGQAAQDFDREYGFVSRLSDFGMKVWRTEMGVYAQYRTGRDATRRLMAGRECPDAIFCADDVLAIAAIDVLREEMKLSVPEDISVVGFHNIHDAALPLYSLTTMCSPIDVMVDAVIQIINHLDEKDKSETIIFPMKPVIRRTMRIQSEKYLKMQQEWIVSAAEDMTMHTF